MFKQTIQCNRPCPTVFHLQQFFAWLRAAMYKVKEWIDKMVVCQQTSFFVFAALLNNDIYSGSFVALFIYLLFSSHTS